MIGLVAGVFLLVLCSAAILSDPTTGWDRTAVVAMWLSAAVGGLRGGLGEALVTGACGAIAVGAVWVFWTALLSALASW